ncbi:Hypothetical predicted protein [Pelobates cultripes]|uniref:Uncharacterized protein n=1 Tax=Pelobates cultripes TaxID=61616 RepID=A0AAD1VLD4_PELCU|nr:Hypothetical predicted protein [Pelobates cultripes]
MDDATLMASVEFQTLLDGTMTNSISKALTSAMVVMSSTITQSITQALMQAQLAPHAPMQRATVPNITLPGHKALCKPKHAIPPPIDQVTPGLTDTPQAVHDGAQQLCNRATGRAKAPRTWKWVRAQEILSGSYFDPYEAEIFEGEDLAWQQFASSLSIKDLSMELFNLTGSGKLWDT